MFLPGENPLLSIGVVSVQLRRNLLTGARGELGGRASTRSVFEQIWQIVFFVLHSSIFLTHADSDISSLFVSVFLISVFVTIFHDGGCANVTASVSFSWQSERENDTKIFLRKMKVKVTQNNSSLCQRQMCTWLGGKWRQSSAKQEKNISRCFPKNIFQLFFLSLFGLFPVSVLYWWWFPGAALVNLTQENGAVHFNQSLIHQDCSRNTWQQELFFFILIWTQAGLSPKWVSWWRLSLFSSTWPTVSSIKIYTQSFF